MTFKCIDAVYRELAITRHQRLKKKNVCPVAHQGKINLPHWIRLLASLPGNSLIVMRLSTSKINATVDEIAAAHGRPSLAEAAMKLQTSPRTLQRILEREGRSFTDIVEERLAERARRLLKSPSLDIHSISEELGYSDPSSFSRAFRRWTGQCPRVFRREQS